MLLHKWHRGLSTFTTGSSLLVLFCRFLLNKHLSIQKCLDGFLTTILYGHMFSCLNLRFDKLKCSWVNIITRPTFNHRHFRHFNIDMSMIWCVKVKWALCYSRQEGLLSGHMWGLNSKTLTMPLTITKCRCSLWRHFKYEIIHEKRVLMWPAMTKRTLRVENLKKLECCLNLKYEIIILWIHPKCIDFQTSYFYSVCSV